MTRIAATIVSVFLLALPALGAEQPSPESVLNTLVDGHPRLMLTDGALAALKARSDNDPVLKGIVQDVIEDADRRLRERPLVYKKVGPRLLSVSRECLGRVYDLALAYRWTGDERYAAKAKETVLTVCDFQDWNPSHFLDTAEMSHAVGIGYDWLYGYLTPAERARIAERLGALGLDPAIERYEKNYGSFRGAFNWNQVCNSGMLTGALAVADIDPERAGYVVSRAVSLLPNALKTYAPDGVWPEGPGYWSYATRYTAYGLTALNTALGTDFGLSEIPGLDMAGDFPIYMSGPTGLYFNFADVGERSSRRTLPELFFLARTYHKSFYADSEHAMIKQYGGRATHVVWYTPPSGEAHDMPLDVYFGGEVETAALRSSWEKHDALWVAVKAGYNQVNHGQLDLGTFELDALGERWVRDLGSDDYNLPDYWNSRVDGTRWTYYRLGSHSHSIPTLDGMNQHPEGKSKFTACIAGGKDLMTDRPASTDIDAAAQARIDYTSAYPSIATRAERTVTLSKGRGAVLIEDQFDLTKPADFLWGITTDADIEIDGSKATLRLNGKEMRVRIEHPAGLEFTQASAEQQPPQKQNKGVKRLLIDIPQAKGTVDVIVKFAPVSTPAK